MVGRVLLVGSGLWERVYVAKSRAFFQEQTYVFIKAGALYQYSTSYTAFLPTKVERSPLQIVSSFPELFVSKESSMFKRPVLFCVQEFTIGLKGIYIV